MPIVSSKSLHSDGVSIAGMKTASVAERPHPICEENTPQAWWPCSRV